MTSLAIVVCDRCGHTQAVGAPRDESMPGSDCPKCYGGNLHPPASRTCSRCGETKPRDDFHGRGRLCSKCRASDDAPKVTEAEWQVTVTQALHVFQWSTMHVRRTRGRHGWTTATSADGWPDLTAMRGPHILGIELKTDAGAPTDEQVEWLGRFSRLVGGRAWLIRPSDPDWDTFVAWLREPAHAPRRHGW